MRAREARQLSNMKNGDAFSTHLDNIHSDVINAALKGNTSISYDFSTMDNFLSVKLIYTLSDEGYMTKYNPNTNTYTISW